MSTPLAGRRIAVTRPVAQADELAALLRAVGASVLTAPLIRIAPSIDSDAVRDAIAGLSRFEWVIFTSANGVELFSQALRSHGVAAVGLRVACVGPATAAAAERQGFSIEVVPQDYLGDAIPDALARKVGLTGARVLVPRAAGARQELIEQLRERGAEVSQIELYRSVMDEAGTEVLRESLSSGRVDVLTFTAGSAVRYFADAIGQPGAALVAVIGPITSDAARAHGLTVSIVADPHTARGLVDSIIRYFAAGS